MILPIALLEVAPDRVRVRSGWIEAAGVRTRWDFQIQPGDHLAGHDFADLLAAARAGQRLLLDESDGALRMEEG